MLSTNTNNGFNSLGRMNRGMEIAQKKTSSENSDGSFFVPSATVDEILYLVRFVDGKYLCNCIDFKERASKIGEACKHVHAVKFWVASQVELKQEPKPKIFSEDSIQCDKCGSIRVIRYGSSSQKQAFYCKDCKHKFVPSLIKKAKYSPETISLTLDLYFSGLSLRKIARALNDHYDLKLGSASIYRWIQRYVPIISEYANSLNPQLSDTWHADELFVKMKDGVEYKADTREWHRIAFLWNVMDRKTRFLLSSKLSAYRDKDGAFQAFKEARNNSHGQFPEKIFVDVARAYNNIAHAQVKHWNPQVIARSGINKPHANNNRIERLNGTLRERVKVQRGWKSMESQIAEGQRIHYNFVKPNQALEGMTPAQRAGLQTKGWTTLLQQALTNQSETARENN